MTKHLTQYSLGGLFCDGAVEVQPLPDALGYAVCVSLLVPDRHDGEKRYIKLRQNFMGPEPPPDDYVWCVFAEMALHEAKESFRVNGQLWRDPHLEKF